MCGQDAGSARCPQVIAGGDRVFEPYLADYRYYALFERQTTMSDVGIALGLFRSVSFGHEQRYCGHGVWKRSRDLADSLERDSYADYREVSAAELELLTRLIDERASPRPEEAEPAAVVVLLAARRRAEPVDGHYCFARADGRLPRSPGECTSCRSAARRPDGSAG